MSTRQEYRPDIDGLRAISVIAVMLFHFFPSLLPGGFTGVDVFFVISGFLVTKSILTDLQTKTFTLKEFYARRIRRIIPATLPVYVACLTFGMVFMLTEDNSEMGEKALYSLGMIKNHFLMIKSDYFIRSFELNSFTHFWSLSIEEQFYFIWAPIVLLTSSSSKSRFLNTLAVIFFLSLALNLYLVTVDAKLAFYLLPTRMWELVAGAALCVLGNRIRFTIPQQNILSGLALLTLVGAFLLIDETNQFPGYLALLPVVSSALFIATPQSFFNRILSGKIFVAIGLMSYSLYLWHWPLLSFLNSLFPSQLSNFDLSLLLAVTFLIAYLSYRFVESPARKMPVFHAARYSLAGLFVVILGAGVIAGSDGKLVLHPQLEQYATDIEDYDDDERLMPEFCHDSHLDHCALSRPEEAPTVAIIGDSHASHWFPGLRDYYDSRNENILMLIQDNSPPFIDVKSPLFNSSDKSQAFKIVTENPSIHTVILSAFWSVYANEDSMIVGKELMKVRIRDPKGDPSSPQQRHFASLLIKTIVTLQQAGKKVIFLHDVPVTPFLGDKFMPRPFFEIGYPICAFEEHVCTFSYEGVKKMQMNYRQVISNLVPYFSNVKVFDPLPLFCNSRSELCLSHPHGKMVYSDEHHIGIEGSKFLIPKFFNPE